MPFPHVSSEGGPVLLSDFDALRSWRGAYHDPGDYERVCETMGDEPLTQIQVGAHHAIAWHIGGPGTADIIQVSPTHISIVRIWPDASWTENDCDQAAFAAACERFGEHELARLSISSGYLLALLAPEDMSAGGDPSGDLGVPEDLSIGDGGAYVRLQTGCYVVTACEWHADIYDVTKIDLKLLP